VTFVVTVAVQIESCVLRRVAGLEPAVQVGVVEGVLDEVGRDLDLEVLGEDPVGRVHAQVLLRLHERGGRHDDAVRGHGETAALGGVHVVIAVHPLKAAAVV